MAKPNYDFEKRQRELAKKRKKEEKKMRKAGQGEPQPADDDSAAEPVAVPPADGTTPAP